MRLKSSLRGMLCVFIVVAGFLILIGQVHAAAPSGTSNIALFQSFDENFASTNDFQRVASTVHFVWGASSYNIKVWKQFNPTIELANYLPFNRDPRDHSLKWWQKNDPDWIVYRCDRRTPAYKGNESNIPLDISNPAVITWQLQNFVIPAAQEGYTAIGWDNVDPNWSGACGHYLNGQWVQRYSGTVGDTVWRGDVLNWLSSMKQQMHALSPSLLLVPNVDFQGWDYQGLPVLEQMTNNADQILEEQGFIGPNRILGTTWNDLINWVSYTQAQGKMFYSSNAPSHNPNEPDVLWTLANYFLVNQGRLSIWISKYQHYGSPIKMYPEYSAAALQQPTGPPYLSQNLYRRDYTGGLVLANTGTTPLQFTVPGQKKDLNGKPVSGQITVASGTGVVLLNA